MDNIIEMIRKVDVDLLDSQIKTLHEIEVMESLTDSQREDVTGLLNFLSLLFCEVIELEE